MLITRTVDATELDIITEWWYQEWKETYLHYGVVSLYQAREDVKHRVQSGTMTVFVAREGSNIISVAALVSQRDPAIPSGSLWLSNMYTIESCRREGYGTQVVREILRYTTGITGDNTLFVSCTDDLVHWYESLGFIMRSRSDIGITTMSIDTRAVSPTLRVS